MHRCSFPVAEAKGSIHLTCDRICYPAFNVCHMQCFRLSFYLVSQRYLCLWVGHLGEIWDGLDMCVLSRQIVIMTLGQRALFQTDQTWNQACVPSGRGSGRPRAQLQHGGPETRCSRSCQRPSSFSAPRTAPTTRTWAMASARASSPKPCLWRRHGRRR